MLQELAVQTGASIWAIASLFFFLLAFLAVAVHVWRTEPAAAEACARLPLAGDDQPAPGAEDDDSLRA